MKRSHGILAAALIAALTSAGAGAAPTGPVDSPAVTAVIIGKEQLRAAEPDAKSKAESLACLSNLKQLGLGVLMYAQDHGEHFPDANRWMDEIMPYVKNKALFKDPADTSGHATSYAYNRMLSGATMASIASPADTMMIFDSTLGTWNASDTGQSIPRPQRHDGANNYAYADGHVKRVDDITPMTNEK